MPTHLNAVVHFCCTKLHLVYTCNLQRALQPDFSRSASQTRNRTLDCSEPAAWLWLRMFPARSLTHARALDLVRYHWTATYCNRRGAAMHRVAHHRHMLSFACKLSPARRPWSLAGPHTPAQTRQLLHVSGSRRAMCRAAAETDDLVPGVPLYPLPGLLPP